MQINNRFVRSNPIIIFLFFLGFKIIIFFIFTWVTILLAKKFLFVYLRLSNHNTAPSERMLCQFGPVLLGFGALSTRCSLGCLGSSLGSLEWLRFAPLGLLPIFPSIGQNNKKNLNQDFIKTFWNRCLAYT